MEKRSSLKQLFAFWLVGLLIVSMSLTVYLAYSFTYHRTLDDAKLETKRLAARLSLITERVINTDPSLVKETISDIALNYMVKDVVVTDADLRIIFASDFTLVGKRLTDTEFASQKLQIFSAAKRTPEVIQPSRHVLVSGTSFTWPASEGLIRSGKSGWVFVDCDIESLLHNRIRHELLERMVSALLVVLITVITWIVVYRRIASPLKQLTKASYRVSAGDYFTKLPHMSFDEVEQIRDGFQKMSVEVEQKINSLVASENRFRLLLQSAPVGIVAFNRHKQLRQVNEVFLQMSGLDETDLQQNLSLQDFCELMNSLSASPKDDGLRLMELDSGLHQKGTDAGRLILSQQQHARVLKTMLIDISDSEISKVLYFQDITPEYEMDETKSRFIATAAHELRTPMTVINGYAELLLHKGEQLNNKQAMLQAIKAESDDVVELLNELLDIAKIDNGQASVEMVACRIDEIVAQVCERFQPKDSQRDVKCSSEAVLPLLHGNPQKIKQAVKACLSNAFKYSADNSQVSVRVQRGQFKQADAVEVLIEDKGIGMSDYEIARASERFYRADDSGKIAGTGLGLSLVKEIMLLHGGEMSISSQQGQGTTVKLLFPVK
jgi:signal transduction histidine kinase